MIGEKRGEQSSIIATIVRNPWLKVENVSGSMEQ